MIDLLSDAVENSDSEIYGRVVAFESGTPLKPSRPVPIKINNGSIYKAQLSLQDPEAALCQTTSRTQHADRSSKEKKCVCVCVREREGGKSVMWESGSVCCCA